MIISFQNLLKVTFLITLQSWTFLRLKHREKFPKSSGISMKISVSMSRGELLSASDDSYNLCWWLNVWWYDDAGLVSQPSNNLIQLQVNNVILFLSWLKLALVARAECDDIPDDQAEERYHQDRFGYFFHTVQNF